MNKWEEDRKRVFRADVAEMQEQMRTLRKAKKLTYHDIGREVDLEHATIWGIFNNPNSTLPYPHVKKIMAVLNK
jgi:transcriptional regulator with XRE-family HTH domain